MACLLALTLVAGSLAQQGSEDDDVHGSEDEQLDVGTMFGSDDEVTINELNQEDEAVDELKQDDEAVDVKQSSNMEDDIETKEKRSPWWPWNRATARPATGGSSTSRPRRTGRPTGRPWTRPTGGRRDNNTAADIICKGTCANLKRNCGTMLRCGNQQFNVSKYCPATCSGGNPTRRPWRTVRPTWRPTRRPRVTYVDSVGACRGGNSPARNGGRKFYGYGSCRHRCDQDPRCTGYTMPTTRVGHSSRWSWCETYSSRYATGDRRARFSCHMKVTHSRG